MANFAEALEITEVDLDAITDLRERALSPGHPGRLVVWPYDLEGSPLHLGAFRSGGLVGCVSATLTPLDGFPGQVYRFHSMGVEPAVQGQGVGMALLGVLFDRLASSGGSYAWATARPSAVGFYERFGMQVLTDRTFLVEETGLVCSYVVQALA